MGAWNEVEKNVVRVVWLTACCFQLVVLRCKWNGIYL